MADEAGLDFSEIVREHRVALEGRALWLTKSESDAADLFQETLEHALRGPRRALSPEVVRRWLYTIMYNVFLDRWRAQAVRRTVVFDRRLEEQVAHEEPAAVPLWRTIDDDVLYACIARLPHSMKEIVELQLEGVSYAELARLLGLPASTVGTRLLRARRRLRDLLAAAIRNRSDTSGIN
jgi:RNA polymerase sigma-70 factor (ECF subfamily)